MEPCFGSPCIKRVLTTENTENTEDRQAPTRPVWLCWIPEDRPLFASSKLHNLTEDFRKSRRPCRAILLTWTPLRSLGQISPCGLCGRSCFPSIRTFRGCALRRAWQSLVRFFAGQQGHYGRGHAIQLGPGDAVARPEGHALFRKKELR
jgi:hypothetical protein